MNKNLMENQSVKDENVLAKFGRASFRTAAFLMNRKPVIGIGLNLAFLFLLSAFPAIAQTLPNPWGGGSGSSRLANVGSNILVFATWTAFFVGILSFVLIPIFIKMEWDYQKLIFSGVTGIGGFTIFGAIAYDIVNLSSVTMSDPTAGN